MNHTHKQQLEEKLQILEQLYKKDPAKGIELSNEIISEASKSSLSVQQARGLVFLGYCYFFQAELKTALEAFHKALSLFIEEDDSKGIIRAENGISSICLKTRQYVEAIQHLEFIQDLSLKTNDIHGLSLAYINMGMTYCKLEEFEKASSHLSNAEKIIDLTHNNQHRGTINLIYGTLYSKKGNFTIALDYLHRLLIFLKISKLLTCLMYLLRLLKSTLSKMNYQRPNSTCRQHIRLLKKAA